MLTTNIEKEFVLECILSKVRCDGRQLFDYRKLTVSMLKERGIEKFMKAMWRSLLAGHTSSAGSKQIL